MKRSWDLYWSKFLSLNTFTFNNGLLPDLFGQLVFNAERYVRGQGGSDKALKYDKLIC